MTDPIKFKGILVDDEGEFEVAYFTSYENALRWSRAMSTAWQVKIERCDV